MSKKAQPGTVIAGTLRTADLLLAFAAELDCLDTEGKWSGVTLDARNADPEAEYAQDIIAELMDALEEFAPEGCYFGTHEGDGADFGFWYFEDEDPYIGRADDDYGYCSCCSDRENFSSGD